MIIDNTKKKRGLIYGSIIIITLIFLSLIFNDSMWGDESFTMLMIKHKFIEIPQYTAIDVHPPLYYYIAKAFCVVFGYSVPVVKIVSIIPVMLSMILVWRKSQKLFPQYAFRISFIFNLLIGLNPKAFTYSIQLRMYTWASFFVLCSVLLALEIYKEVALREVILFIVVGLCGAYTHYYVIVAEVFIYITLIVAIILKNRKNIKASIIIVGCTIIGYMPWIPLFTKQISKTKETFWLEKVSLSGIGGSVEFLFKGKFMVPYVIIMLIIIASIIEIFIKKRNYMTKVSLLCISLYGAVLATGIIASKLIRPVFLNRYLFVSAGTVFFGIAIGLCCIEHEKVIRNILIAVIIASFPFSYSKALKQEYHTGTKRALKKIEKKIPKNAVILTDNGLDWTTLPYYLPKRKVYAIEKVKSDTRGYIITKKKEYQIRNIIEGAKVKKLFKGNIDNYYKFGVYYIK